MASPLRVRTLPEIWRFAFIGAIASLPITVLVNWLPNSEATIGAGIMIFGAFIAGIIAATRASDPSAAGLRAGFIGGVFGLLIFLVTAGTTATWSRSSVIFFVFASGLVVCVAPLFGRGCGRVGGWVANTIASR
ncbi:DUF5518 domain-containing protein [Halostagnicola kamekurae]|uniref:TIGR04086 family membrane protein n=1 Tax=Halostagnicola kamekurae TaxID=619731 RepID=A0A1I6P1R1_9EURY|nr:DUF5518 domain-containing protein [Halostagnicola kamekurae]SFS34137.1 hypothetical protein SAMN04488556_0267 [Halostagnicola kamekurae]